MKRDSLIAKKRIGAFFLIAILMISGSATLPQRAYASDADSPLQLAKDVITSVTTGHIAVSSGLTAITSVHTLLQDTTLNPLAWIVSKAALQSVVKSMVTWAAHGFNGAPSFVTDLNKQLLSVSDSAANGFLSQLSSNGSIKSPFQTAVASAVGTNYSQSTSANGFFTQNPFTLGQTSPNPTTALSGGMFTQQGGGLNAWLSAWSNPANNPFGATMLASNALGSQVSNAQSIQKAELNWGQGFLASRGNCPQTTTGGTTQTTASSSTVSLSAPSTCQSQPIQLLGTTANAAVSKALGSGVDTLVNAHTFGEVFTAALTQMLSGAVTSGIASLTQPASSSGGAGILNQPADPTQVATVNSIGTTFASTLSGQITQLQQFVTEWTTIQNAAYAAESTLTQEPCANAQSTITTQVQPVLSQAATSLAEASTSMAAIQKIQAELPPTNSTTDQTAVISTATTDYTNLLQTDPLLNPSSTAMQDAVTQSTDTSSDPTQPQSLLSQMNALAQQTNAICGFQRAI
jgi:hypothetical protein